MSGPGQYVPPMMIFRRIRMTPVLGEGVFCEWSGPVRTTHDDIQEDKDDASIGRGCSWTLSCNKQQKWMDGFGHVYAVA